MKGISVPESAKLIAGEWKALSDSEKKVRLGVNTRATYPLTGA